MSQVQKIFVNTDEEIAFTIEHILSNVSNRVILIVPQNAALTSSAVSLKMLSRRLVNTPKHIILVTDDQTGTILGEKAGLLVMTKISDVNKEAWLESKRLKERLVSNKNRIKKELLNERKVDNSKIELGDLGPAVVKETKEDLVKARVEDPTIVDKKEKVKDVLPISKPRLPAKVIDVNGIKFISGGDIVDFMDKIDMPKSEIDGKDIIEKDELENFAVDSKKDTFKNPIKRSGLLGKDLGKATSSRKTPSRRNRSRKKKINFDWLKPVQNSVGLMFKSLGKGNNGMQILKYGLVAIVVFFIVSYIFFPAVTITLEFAEDQVRLNEQVTASIDIEEVDNDALQIPAIQISKAVTGSGDGKSTGVGSTGEVARGIIDISNNSSDDIVLAVGTVLTTIGGSELEYKLTQQVVVPGEDDIQDITIEAISFGANYNTSQRITMTVAGYNSADVVVYAIRDITGGTTEETIVASKEDLDALKATVEEDLKAELLSKLQEVLSEEDKLLAGSEKFEIITYEVSAKEGDEVEKFSADMEMAVTAVKVTDNDLALIAEEVVRLQEGSTEGAQIDLFKVTIDDIEINDKGATFNIIFDADIQEDLDIEEIKKVVAGKKVSEARSYLEDLDGLADFRLKYTPSYIPMALQKVPIDLEKIEVIKTVE